MQPGTYPRCRRAARTPPPALPAAPGCTAACTHQPGPPPQTRPRRTPLPAPETRGRPPPSPLPLPQLSLQICSNNDVSANRHTLRHMRTAASCGQSIAHAPRVLRMLPASQGADLTQFPPCVCCGCGRRASRKAAAAASRRTQCPRYATHASSAAGTACSALHASARPWQPSPVTCVKEHKENIAQRQCMRCSKATVYRDLCRHGRGHDHMGALLRWPHV